MRRWVIGASVGTVALSVAVFAASTLPKSRTFQLAGELILRVDVTEKMVALSFDDGPTEWTPGILNTLEVKQIPATFYLNGADLDRHPDQGAAIARPGHIIGNHAYTPPNDPCLGRDCR